MTTNTKNLSLLMNPSENQTVFSPGGVLPDAVEDAVEDSVADSGVVVDDEVESVDVLNHSVKVGVFDGGGGGVGVDSDFLAFSINST